MRVRSDCSRHQQGIHTVCPVPELCRCIKRSDVTVHGVVLTGSDNSPFGRQPGTSAVTRVETIRKSRITVITYCPSLALSALVRCSTVYNIAASIGRPSTGVACPACHQYRTRRVFSRTLAALEQWSYARPASLPMSRLCKRVGCPDRKDVQLRGSAFCDIALLSPRSINRAVGYLLRVQRCDADVLGANVRVLTVWIVEQTHVRRRRGPNPSRMRCLLCHMAVCGRRLHWTPPDSAA